MKDFAAGVGRWLGVAPERFPGWVESFARRHGAGAPDSGLAVVVTSDHVTFTAPDEALAKCYPPFWEPQVGIHEYAGMTASEAARAIAGDARRDRAVGVLLVRLGGYAAGVFTGSPPVLADSKTGSRLVHGRSAAGGWSQQRFARRREKQAGEALHAAADAAVEVWERWAAQEGRSAEKRSGAGQDVSGGIRGTPRTGLDVVVFGGDKRAIAEVSGDPRLAAFLELATPRFLTVPDPRFAVLRDSPRLFRAVRIFLVEPGA